MWKILIMTRHIEAFRKHLLQRCDAKVRVENTRQSLYIRHPFIEIKLISNIPISSLRGYKNDLMYIDDDLYRDPEVREELNDNLDPLTTICRLSDLDWKGFPRFYEER